MKINLLAKYIILYFFIAIVSFVAVTFVCYRKDYDAVYNQQTKSMYRQAAYISNQYGSDFPDTAAMRLSLIHI